MFRLFAAPDLPERRCRWTQIWGKAFLRLNGRAGKQVFDRSVRNGCDPLQS